ncbi:MAG: transglycosylase domain-containing protein [Chloroflexota bacterium]
MNELNSSQSNNDKPEPLHSDSADEVQPTWTIHQENSVPQDDEETTPEDIFDSEDTVLRPPPWTDPDATLVQSSGIPGRTHLGPPDWQPLRDENSVTRPTSRPTTPPDPLPSPPNIPPPPPMRPRPYRPSTTPRQKNNGTGCFLKTLIYGIIIALIFAFIGVSAAAVGYIAIASQLPPPDELASRASDFETGYILDSEGNLLYELIPSDMGRRQRVTLKQISPLLIQATIDTEDRYFYQHPGFDPIGIARAAVQNLIEREIVSGASTITQQVARGILMTPEERVQETASRKIREAILATEISRRYSKDEVLELYLNEINYGNLAYGIEAASQTYFGKNASELNLSEASLLAGLPQAPAAWDPYTAPELALGRQSQVLALMVEAGSISRENMAAAMAEMESRIYDLEPPRVDMVYPHFVSYVRQELEGLMGPQSSYRQGIRVFTSIVPQVQQAALDTVTEHQQHYADWGANNTALVAVHPETGRILAMVGSMDFYDDSIDGQVNVSLSGRQPGSSIKPLTYVTNLEEGWTPSTLIWDVPVTFSNEWGQTYTPKNYDDRFHGPTLLRDALANSYNIPAVKGLNQVGVCNLIERANQIGISSLNDTGCDTVGKPSDYWLALTLGGGEISPMEMVSFYATLANNGNRIDPVSIVRIEDLQGNLIYEAKPEPKTVIRAEHAYLISDILSDNNARMPAFGQNNWLQFNDRRVAAKTGTSGTNADDVRDAWTIGYTPQIAVGVWVGNTDNSPMAPGASGYRIASPVWRSFMERVLSNMEVVDFARPAGIVQTEICVDSGTIPSEDCPADRRKMELFANNQPPLSAEHDIYRRKQVDLWTGMEANEHCTEAVEERLYVVIDDKTGRAWVEETASGRQWAANRNITMVEYPGDPSPRLPLPPSVACGPDTPRPQVILTSPNEGQRVLGELILYGRVIAPNMRAYRVEYGEGGNPIGWGLVSDWNPSPVEAGEIARWNTRNVKDYEYTLRVLIAGPVDKNGNEVLFEHRVHVNVLNPTPTPTETPTPTQTPTSTLTPTPTETPTETPTPTLAPVTLVPTPTKEKGPPPTETPPPPSPSPTSTPPPAETPTPTP